jgi:hypothetical protein
MPLTIAHPAAVLPFRHAKLPFSALIIGSLAPDFEYVLHLSPRSCFSHTTLGLFVFCVPAGLLALWIFHRIWTRPMLAMLGKPSGPGLERFRFGPLPRFLVLCGELLIGALLHVIWDSFTHDHGWLVQRIAGLRQNIHVAGRLGLPLYLVLQHVSSLLGLGVLLFLAFHHRTWKLPPFTHHWPLLVIVGWMTIGGGVALGMLVAGDVSNAAGLMRWLGCACVVGTTITVLVTTFLCLVWHLHHRFPGSVI